MIHTRTDPPELLMCLRMPRNKARRERMLAKFKREERREVVRAGKKETKPEITLSLSLWRLRSSAQKMPYIVASSNYMLPGLPEEKKPGARITLAEIMEEISKKHEVSINDIKSASRHQGVIRPRFEFFYRAKTETLHSYPAIGKFCGGRDHTTVMHGVKKFAKDHSLPLPHEV